VPTQGTVLDAAQNPPPPPKRGPDEPVAPPPETIEKLNDPIVPTLGTVLDAAQTPPLSPKRRPDKPVVPPLKKKVHFWDQPILDTPNVDDDEEAQVEEVHVGEQVTALLTPHSGSGSGSGSDNNDNDEIFHDAYEYLPETDSDNDSDEDTFYDAYEYLPKTDTDNKPAKHVQTNTPPPPSTRTIATQTDIEHTIATQTITPPTVNITPPPGQTTPVKRNPVAVAASPPKPETVAAPPQTQMPAQKPLACYSFKNVQNHEAFGRVPTWLKRKALGAVREGTDHYQRVRNRSWWNKFLHGSCQPQTQRIDRLLNNPKSTLDAILTAIDQNIDDIENSWRFLLWRTRLYKGQLVYMKLQIEKFKYIHQLIKTNEHFNENSYRRDPSEFDSMLKIIDKQPVTLGMNR